MLLGLSRARPRLDGRGSLVLTPAGDEGELPSDWLTERGAIRFEASCDVSGGFPGFAQRGGRLSGARLRISDAYLLINEGQPHGFGLPIQWLDGAAVVPGSGRQDSVLRIAYRDGSADRHFVIAVHNGWLPMRPDRNVGQARDVLLDLGLPDRAEDRAPAVADIHVPWDHVRQYESEHVIWTGAATGPLRDGHRRATCEIWLTTRSLIWGSGTGDGLNRLSLTALHDVITGQDEAHHGTPAVYLAFFDPDAGRVDLPFLFDRSFPQRNLRERGAFLLTLRSRDVPLGLPAPLIQPWRISVHRVGSLAAWSMPIDNAAPNGMDATTDGEDTESADPDSGDADDVMLAEFSEPTATREIEEPSPVAFNDYALASDWADDDKQPTAVGSALDVAGTAPATVVDAPVADLESVRAYEAAALAVLAEAMQAIRDRIAGAAAQPLVEPMPTPSLQTSAFAELVDLTARGRIDPTEARSRQARLAALEEAGWRLRSLVELRDAGHITDADLDRKRAEISTDLSARILPPSSDR